MSKTTDEQIEEININIGEPQAGGRFTPETMLKLLNKSRKWTAEQSESFQISDEQPTIVGQARYTLKNDVIEVHSIEYDGHPIDDVRVNEWRDKVGTDETILGTPHVAKTWARQLQLFRVPDRIATFKIEATALPVNLILGGQDPDYFERQQDCSVWRASWIMKAIDERDFRHEKEECLSLVFKLETQYRRKGRRSVHSRSDHAHTL